MRIATPRATWSRMTARGPSATDGIDLDAAVDRPRVHDDRVGLGQLEPARVEAEVARVLARVREQLAADALLLDAQHHHDVGAFERGLDALVHAGAHLGRGPARSSVRGAATRTRAPSLVSAQMFERATRLWRMSPQIATSSPAMRALVRADRRAVEQRLRRVLVRAVARVDDRRAEAAGQHVRPRPPARGGPRPRRAPSRPGCARCRAASRP